MTATNIKSGSIGFGESQLNLAQLKAAKVLIALDILEIQPYFHNMTSEQHNLKLSVIGNGTISALINPKATISWRYTLSMITYIFF